ncbi:MAG TPA: hypothetical protein VGE35_04445 [Candidatus Paceibacterota bacterium]
MDIQKTVQELELVRRLVVKVGGKEGVEGILSGRLKVVDASDPRPTYSPPGIRGDATVMRVDRSKRPVYQTWVKEVLHMDLESDGPDEFDFTKVTFSPRGEAGGIQVWYEGLKAAGQLAGSLGLSDLQAIRKGYWHEFAKVLGDRSVWGLKSAVRRGLSTYFAPVMTTYRGKVNIRWRGLHWEASSSDCIARFPKS